MNTLVEDQLRRLRLTLNAPEVHQWLDTHRHGNRITFGRYNGQTPVPGSFDDKGAQKRLAAWMRDLARQSHDLQALPPHKQAEIFGYFQELSGAEMLTRWDMQHTPPDILITNYSMLNIMLMKMFIIIEPVIKHLQ